MAAVMGIGYGLCFDHQFTGTLGILDLQTHISDFSTSFKVGGTHFFQSPNAAFIACSAGLDALAYPGLLLGELFVEHQILFLFRLESGLSSLKIGSIIAGI